MREIQRAGESAARLTKQLLAFRQRQVLQPIALDVSREIHRIHELIRRLLGEDITFVIKPARGLRCVKADRGFVEQVLFNLAANARDAKRRGGELTVTTAPLELLEPRVAAGHPIDGLHLARSSARPLDLLITDMVMPVMHGRALAEAVTLLHPEMGTLFISGYTDQIVEAGQNFLHKPFTPDAILWKVKDALSRVRVAGQATDTAIAS